MKIKICQISPVLGDIEHNKILILNSIKKSRDDIIVFPELSLTGYPPTDMLNEIETVRKVNLAVNDILEVTKDRHQLLIMGVPVYDDGYWYNSALSICNGEIIYRYDKQLLPNYDIFCESRYFKNNKYFTPYFKWNDKTIAILICEDIWFNTNDESYIKDPLDKLIGIEIDVLIHIAASPFEKNKPNDRLNQLKGVIKKLSTGIISVNQVGAYTDIIFDGSSQIIDRKGVLVMQAPSFEVAELTYILGESEISNQLYVEEDLTQKAIQFGLREYLKRSGFSRCVVGLSGGIDSAVVAVLAVQAIGAENVECVTLPTQYNSSETFNDAIELANRLGCVCKEVSIDALRQNVDGVMGTLVTNELNSITVQNIQARIRGMILMGLSNEIGALLLTTGNKSELAMGYATLYGDMCGGLNIIGDLFKTEVYALANLINTNEEVIPQSIIERKPSAELAPNQFDSDSLPEYEMMDTILDQIMVQKLPLSNILKMNDNIVVNNIIHKLKVNEFKRFQSPPILKLSKQSFGRGWHYPIVR